MQALLLRLVEEELPLVSFSNSPSPLRSLPPLLELEVAEEHAEQAQYLHLVEPLPPLRHDRNLSGVMWPSHVMRTKDPNSNTTHAITQHR